MDISARELESSRQLVLQILRRERTVQAEPQLIQDDLLYFAVAALSRDDPGWLLRRLVDRELDYDTRVAVMTQTSGPLRRWVQPFLRAECPTHEIWQHPATGQSTGESSWRHGYPQCNLLVSCLGSESANRRDRAAEELRDLCASRELARESFCEVADALLFAAFMETDPVVLESVLNALCELANHPDAGYVNEIDWSPLAARLEDLSDVQCLQHAVDALGAVGKECNRRAISRLKEHPSPAVRERVAAALHQIDLCTNATGES